MTAQRNLASFEAAIEGLSCFVQGRRLLLLGSAPVLNLDLPEHELLATVNASHSAYGIDHVDILFLNSYSLRKPRDANDVRACFLGAFDRISCDMLVVIDGAGTYVSGQIPSKQEIVLSRADRNAFLSQALEVELSPTASGEDVPSTGMHAALLLMAAGCKPAYKGFSLQQGHVLKADALRKHVEIDARIFEKLGIPASPTASGH